MMNKKNVEKKTTSFHRKLRSWIWTAKWRYELCLLMGCCGSIRTILLHHTVITLPDCLLISRNSRAKLCPFTFLVTNCQLLGGSLFVKLDIRNNPYKLLPVLLAITVQSTQMQKIFMYEMHEHFVNSEAKDWINYCDQNRICGQI